MSYDPSLVAFVDVETTGLDPEHDAIWEIAVIVDGFEVVWQQTLTDRQIDNVHPEAARITNFYERYKAEETTPPSSSIRRLISLVEGRHLIGACPWFDSDRLHRLVLGDIRRTLGRQLPWHYHLIDVENLAVGYLKGRAEFSGWVYLPPEIEEGDPVKMARYLDDRTRPGLAPPLISRTDPPVWETLPWKSRELSAALGVDPAEFQPEHTALADARWAKAIYEAIMGEPRCVCGEQTLGDGVVHRFDGPCYMAE